MIIITDNKHNKLNEQKNVIDHHYIYINNNANNSNNNNDNYRQPIF